MDVPEDEDHDHERPYDGVETHILEITRHDKQDIIVGRQYFVLFLDDAKEGHLLVSNISRPLSSERGL